MAIKKTSEFYTSHTSIKWKKIGDALLGVSTASAVPAILMDYKFIGIGLFLCGVIGNFLTRYFKED